MRNAMLINKKDNVIVAVEALKKGTAAVYETECHEEEVVAAEDIQMYHKLARRDIKKGEQVIKYGEYIGEAGEDISLGSHVHTHNVLSIREKVVE